VGILDAWTAYQFDMAILHLCRRVESELAKGKKGGSLANMLADKPAGSGMAMRRLAGPSGIRKVKLDERGIW